MSHEEETPETTPQAVEDAEQPDGVEAPAGEPEDVEAEPAPVADEDLTDRERELTLRYQRVAADFANYQKRMQREKARWTESSVRDVLKGLLPVFDNLDSAITSFEGDVKDPEVYKQGVVLVRDELLRQLARFDVARIEAEKGEAFDPDHHEAIMVQEVEGIEAQQVSFVARTGYRVGETVLRPAQVGVAKPKG